MPFELTREQLYDLVWSEPMQRLSKKIGISDVAIAKHCRRIGVPVPERGYWNKLQAGHTVTRTPLPERDLTTIRQVQTRRSHRPWRCQVRAPAHRAANAKRRWTENRETSR